MSRHLKIWVVLLTLPLAFPLLSWSQGPSKSGDVVAIPAKPANRADKPPMPESDQMTNIPYFTLRDGLSSTLTLNNLSQSAMPVTITIYNTEGRSQALDTITLDPHSFKQIELRDVVASDLYDSGDLQVSYRGAPMQVTCQVSVYSLDKRVSFESREQDMMDFESANLNGIVSLPQKAAQGFLAVTNVSKNQTTVHVSVGSKTKDMTLYSRQTRVIKLNDEFGLHAPAATLVRLTQTGLPGDIITTGFVMDLENGYSSAFAMTDPKIMRSSHLAGAHFRFGQPDPREGFPAGTTFTSPLLLANVSDKPVTAHVSVDYTVAEKLTMTPIDPKRGDTQDKFSHVAIKDVTIAPGDIQRIELADELARLGVPNPVKESGVDIDYQAPPGSLIGQLVSVDTGGDYSFEVPIKDPAAMNEMIEGLYPWTLENDAKTVLHLKNAIDKEVAALVAINFPGGNYNPPRIKLEPYQTVVIDIQELKDSKTKDVRGQIFPADATHGQVEWLQETPRTIVGRAEQTNLSAGIASSFSCGASCCWANNQWQDNYCLSYDGTTCLGSLTGDLGSTASLRGLNYGTACQGGSFGPIAPRADAGPSSWSSDNPAIATFSWPQVNLVGGGTTNVRATFNSRLYYLGDAGYCTADDTNAYPTSAQITARYPYRVEPIATTAQSFVVCGSNGNGWFRNVTNQLQAQDGGGFLHAGIVMADRISFTGTNQLGLSPVTGSDSTDSNGSWSDFYSVCSPQCANPSSPGESDAIQYWTYNGLALPHSNLVVYKCGSITIDGF